MLWKTVNPSTKLCKYVAVKEIEHIDNPNMLYGEREYRITLADNTVQKWKFNPDEYEKWEASLLKGGQIINP